MFGLRGPRPEGASRAVRAAQAGVRIRVLRLNVLAALGLAAASLLAAGCAPAPAAAATMGDRIGKQTGQDKNKGKEQALVQADEMAYDKDNDRISARGHVQLYYQGRVLQADTVTYDRKSDRVLAEGHAKLTEADGTVAYGDRFDLTGDFKNGFIDSLRSDTADKTHMNASRVERAEGETTVFERGTYTACEPCKEDASKPPTWQVKAKRIIHKNDEQTIYYEDATLELWGVPIAYMPYFSTPDPSVKRKSGVLAPKYSTSSARGFGVSVPYFFALAPDYDLTVTPTYYTRQGLMGEAEWRQRFINGSYDIRAAGIFQQDPSVFAPAPYGPGNKTFRGLVESDGTFYLNEHWKYGWSLSLMTDRWFLQDYQLPSENMNAWYFKEKASTVFLTGQADRGYFDMRGIFFQPLTRNDLQSQQPVVGPLIDYNKVIPIDPKKSHGIGGEVTIDANFTNLNRDLAAYQSTGARQLDSTVGLYDVCADYQTRSDCLLRGIGGEYTRATLNLSWQRNLIDPLGSLWSPFAFAHVNGAVVNLNDSNSAPYYNAATPNTACDPSVPPCSTINNANQGTFVGSHDLSFRGTAVPGVGVEWKYPLISSNAWATQVFEPIAQVIVRPDETTNRALVNEDSQSLVFDDTNLFEWNKFSGYDRFEGGTRANYGAQYTATFQNGGYVNALVGQSYQLAGRNSYDSPDAANIGLQSGLDTRASNYVTRLAIAPTSMFAFIAKTQLDPTNFDVKRLDLMANGKFGPLELGVQYARYDAQPLIGFNERREGVSTTAKYKIDDKWFATGNVVFDMSRHLYNDIYGGHAPLFSLAGLGAGVGYSDDCLALSVNYTSVYQDNGTGTTPVRNQTVLVQLQFRTLGDTSVKSNLGNVAYTDGIGSPH